MKLIPKVVLGLSVLTFSMLAIQYSVQQMLRLSREPIVAQKTGYSAIDIERIVSDSFQVYDRSPPEKGESRRFESVDVQEYILTDLRDRNVEVYVIEGSDEIRWRIYNKDSLQYQLLFPSQPDPTAKTDTPTDLIKLVPKNPVALLLTGTKYKDLKPLLDLDIPLNLALEPTSPFALRNAVLGARNWHEIVLDIRKSSEFVVDALPFSTALLSTTPLPIESMNVIVAADTAEITIAQTNLPNTTIWRLNMAKLTTNDVQQWIESLPTTLQFVRLSYWDLTPG